jgi:cytochrome c1
LVVRVGGQEIRTTAEHPFYVYNKGWVAAHRLEAGDHLGSHDGQWVRVEGVEERGEYATVYNLRVADFHTYFVGCQQWGFSVWAHNSNECVNVKALRDAAGIDQTTADYTARIIRSKGEQAGIDYLVNKKKVDPAVARKAIEAGKVKPPAPITDKTYARPGGTDWRVGEREAVWDLAVKESIAQGKGGKVYDAVTGKEIKFTDKWEMGHKPKYEFWKHQQSAKQRGISRKEFLEEYHNPEHFRPELPESNHSHYGEDSSSTYFGP